MINKIGQYPLTNKLLVCLIIIKFQKIFKKK